jgi:hypothetical protein
VLLLLGKPQLLRLLLLSKARVMRSRPIQMLLAVPVTRLFLLMPLLLPLLIQGDDPELSTRLSHAH